MPRPGVSFAGTPNPEARKLAMCGETKVHETKRMGIVFKKLKIALEVNALEEYMTGHGLLVSRVWYERS